MNFTPLPSFTVVTRLVITRTVHLCTNPVSLFKKADLHIGVLPMNFRNGRQNVSGPRWHGRPRRLCGVQQTIMGTRRKQRDRTPPACARYVPPFMWVSAWKLWPTFWPRPLVASAAAVDAKVYRPTARKSKKKKKQRPVVVWSRVTVKGRFRYNAIFAQSIQKEKKPHRSKPHTPKINLTVLTTTTGLRMLREPNMGWFKNTFRKIFTHNVCIRGQGRCVRGTLVTASPHQL